MVMIIFKESTAQDKSFIVPKRDGYEEQGRLLVRNNQQKSENITIDVRHLERENIYKMAMGAELEDYRFDKYEQHQAQDYPILESVTFLVNNPLLLREEYEPYAALANAIRFAKDMSNEPENLYQTEQYFFEIKRLEYLGLMFKDCGDNLVRLTWKGTEDKNDFINLVASNRMNAAIGAGVMKVVALQKLPINLLCYLKIEGNVKNLLGKNALYLSNNLKNMADVESRLREIYQLLKEKIDEKR